MADQSESAFNASCEANQMKIEDLSDELKGLVIAQQNWLASTTHFVKQGDVYINIDQAFKEEFKDLIEKLNHPKSTQVTLFRTKDSNKPTRVHDSRLKRILYMYPLRILHGPAKVHSDYPGMQGSISKDIRVGTCIIFHDRVFVDGVLEFLIIGVPRQDSREIEHTKKGEKVEEKPHVL
ncbi:hypothetical protein MGYG_07017 [Nannizzia gypsea CBS 118893]|uniref:Uncharacterized protein n=1 Tax=Arthroderma gypseum (strain ATCC MYA-4604 / CBS 118893) TaxID=535722 RepID=E4V1U7_ARTGP|nr:hypothetical protein MGYG_07017 [Nannizzia gypsea CBS 118893]EFR04012.1 hypothetical protein MGYG_07017 [Nannizzia gypsea CBS 118893]